MTRTPQDADEPPDPVIEAYKREIDRTLIRENLKLTPEQRLLQSMALQEFADELREAGRQARAARDRFSGPSRDLEAVAELEAIAEERKAR